MSKPRVIKDYDKLDEEVKEQVKLVYPKGFSQHLIGFTTKDGEKRLGLPFETDDYQYLLRMSVVKAESIVEDDDDYDDSGNLKSAVKKDYEEKYDDVDYLDFNSNDDNDFDDLD